MVASSTINHSKWYSINGFSASACKFGEKEHGIKRIAAWALTFFAVLADIVLLIPRGLYRGGEWTYHKISTQKPAAALMLKTVPSAEATNSSTNPHFNFVLQGGALEAALQHCEQYPGGPYGEKPQSLFFQVSVYRQDAEREITSEQDRLTAISNALATYKHDRLYDSTRSAIILFYLVVSASEKGKILQKAFELLDDDGVELVMSKLSLCYAYSCEKGQAVATNGDSLAAEYTVLDSAGKNLLQLAIERDWAKVFGLFFQKNRASQLPDVKHALNSYQMPLAAIIQGKKLKIFKSIATSDRLDLLCEIAQNHKDILCEWKEGQEIFQEQCRKIFEQIFWGGGYESHKEEEQATALITALDGELLDNWIYNSPDFDTTHVYGQNGSRLYCLPYYYPENLVLAIIDKLSCSSLLDFANDYWTWGHFSLYPTQRAHLVAKLENANLLDPLLAAHLRYGNFDTENLCQFPGARYRGVPQSPSTKATNERLVAEIEQKEEERALATLSAWYKDNSNLEHYFPSESSRLAGYAPLGNYGENLLHVAIDCDWARVFAQFAEEETSTSPLTVYKAPQLKEIPFKKIIVNQRKAIFQSVIEKNRVKFLHQIITNPTLYAELKEWGEGKAIFDAACRIVLDSITSDGMSEEKQQPVLDLLDSLQINSFLKEEEVATYKTALCKT